MSANEPVSAGNATVWLEPDDGTGIRNLFASVDGGRRLGQIVQGTNGEWYHVPLSREAWAYPLDGLDNVHGTGHRTASQAAAAWLAESAGRES